MLEHRQMKGGGSFKIMHSRVIAPDKSENNNHRRINWREWETEREELSQAHTHTHSLWLSNGYIADYTGVDDDHYSFRNRFLNWNFPRRFNQTRWRWWRWRQRRRRDRRGVHRVNAWTIIEDLQVFNKIPSKKNHPRLGSKTIWIFLSLSQLDKPWITPSTSPSLSYTHTHIQQQNCFFFPTYKKKKKQNQRWYSHKTRQDW